MTTITSNIHTPKINAVNVFAGENFVPALKATYHVLTNFLCGERPDFDAFNPALGLCQPQARALQAFCRDFAVSYPEYRKFVKEFYGGR